MAVSFGAVAFDERCGAEVLQAGTGTRQGLATALGTCAGVLERNGKEIYSINKCLSAHLQFSTFEWPKDTRYRVHIFFIQTLKIVNKTTSLIYWLLKYRCRNAEKGRMSRIMDLSFSERQSLALDSS